MEDLRRRLAQDIDLFPDHNVRKDLPTARKSSSPSTVTISSTSSSPVATTKPATKARPIIISSDEEDEGLRKSQPAPSRQGNGPNPLQTNRVENMASIPSKPVAKAIHIPSNKDVQPLKPTGGPIWETFDEPNVANLYDPRTSAAEAEKALRELMEGNIVADEDTEINMDDAIVPGFQEGVTLLPHQVLGRAWMKERESGKKAGGILADDMGLGKTIQTITRIVEGRAKKSDQKEGWSAGTLVVCPVALVAQWASEIRKTAVGLRVIEHHGANRTTDPGQLQRAHVVITSYSIVSSEYASYNSDAKDESTSKSKKKKQSSDSDQDGSDSSAERFGRTLATKKKTTTKCKDALFRVNWWRVVLDEAHNIKNRNTKAAIGCCELEGKYRWCLTGTPMQNSVEELYSLFKFLRIKPLSDWQHFNESINKPVKSGRSVRAMKRLQVVLKSIMLRRQKDHQINGKPIVELPARIVEIVKCEFDSDERAFYHALENKMSDSLDKLIQADQVKNSYTSVLTMLLRLRQACNHPALVSKDYKADREALEPKAAKTMDDDDDDDELANLFGAMGVSRKCQVCQIELSPSTAANDDDGAYCVDCVELAKRSRRKSIHVGASDLPPDSAKTRKVLELLRDIEGRGDGDEKTIIFSQFTSMLDLLQPFLKAKGIKYVRYDGSMRKDQREASLTQIRSSTTIRCILISFKAGSTGLNLTACNNVILVDMWWNPALEEQAFDRAHRFGQERDVNIYKLTIEQTVEERILLLQEQKRMLAKAALSGDKLKNMKLGMDDLLALFRHGGRDEDEDE